MQYKTVIYISFIILLVSCSSNNANNNKASAGVISAQQNNEANVHDNIFNFCFWNCHFSQKNQENKPNSSNNTVINKTIVKINQSKIIKNDTKNENKSPPRQFVPKNESYFRADITRDNVDQILRDIIDVTNLNNSCKSPFEHSKFFIREIDIESIFSGKHNATDISKQIINKNFVSCENKDNEHVYEILHRNTNESYLIFFIQNSFAYDAVNLNINPENLNHLTVYPRPYNNINTMVIIPIKKLVGYKASGSHDTSEYYLGQQVKIDVSHPLQ